MAAKAMMLERRLRPVYDALDNLNNKKAIKLADAILKKQKDVHCAKALKSLALVRTGKASESTPLLDEIKESGDKLDDSTLQAMTMCYKESRCPEGIVSIYEIAVKQTPKNEEFLSHLFMACVRVRDHSKQQQAAMNLYKAFPKNPYYFWAVMSILMQSITSTDAKKKTMFLSLAERMVSKLIKEDKIEAEEEVRMYMMILELREKYDELLKLLESDFGGKSKGSDKLKCVLLEKTDKTIEYLEFLQKWAELNIKYKTIYIKENPDQWSYYKGYLQTFMKLRKQGYKPDVPIDTDDVQPAHTDEEVREFLAQMASENPKIRAPKLALIELEKLFLENSEGSRENLIQEIVQYFCLFGSKPCCFNDLKLYTDLLTEQERIQVIEKLRSNIETASEDSDNKQKINSLMQEICIECLCRRLGIYDQLGTEEKFEKAKSYMKKYKDSLVLGSDILPTAPQHGDVLVLLAVYLLMDINREKGGGCMNWHILLFLEEALESSPSNAQFKLLLFFIYSKIGLSPLTCTEVEITAVGITLEERHFRVIHSEMSLLQGAFGPCDHLIDTIEIKYIMFDTLGYLLNYGSYGSGQFQNTRRLHDSTIGFFAGNQKDTPEQIISSYKFGSFRQVLDISNFMDRVNTSHQFTLTVLDKLYLDVLQHSNSVDEVYKTLHEVSTSLKDIDQAKLVAEGLRDNRDLGVLDNFEPSTRLITDETKKESFQQNVLWVRFRYFSLKALTLCAGYMERNNNTSQMNGCTDENYDPSSLNTILQNMENTIQEATKCSYDGEWLDIHQPPPCKMGMYSQEKHHQVVYTTLKGFSAIADCKTIDDDLFKQLQDDITQNEKILTDCASSFLSSLTIEHNGNKMFNGKSLFHIINFLETATLLTVLLLFTKDLLKRSLANAKKGKKKKTPVSKIEETLKCYESLCSCVGEYMNKLLTALTTTKHDVIDKTLDDAVIDELFDKTNSPTVAKIWQKIQSSYQQSMNEIIQTVELKVKLLDSITQKSHH